MAAPVISIIATVGLASINPGSASVSHFAAAQGHALEAGKGLVLGEQAQGVKFTPTTKPTPTAKPTPTPTPTPKPTPTPEPTPDHGRRGNPGSGGKSHGPRGSSGDSPG